MGLNCVALSGLVWCGMNRYPGRRATYGRALPWAIIWSPFQGCGDALGMLIRTNSVAEFSVAVLDIKLYKQLLYII